MKNVVKIDDKNFKIVDDISSKEFFFAATKKASPTTQGNKPAVQIVDIYEQKGQTVIPLSQLQVNGVDFSNAADACVALNDFVGSFKSGGGSGVSPDYSVEISELMQFMQNIKSMQIKDPEDLKNFSKVRYYDGLLYSLRTSFLISSVSALIGPGSSTGNIYINATGGVLFQTTPTLQKFRYTIVDDETNVQMYQGFNPAYSGFATEEDKKYRITVEDAYDSQTVIVTMFDLNHTVVVTADNDGIFSIGSKITFNFVISDGAPNITEYMWVHDDTGSMYYGKEPDIDAIPANAGRYWIMIFFEDCASPLTKYVDVVVQ